jgi:hypothetical protein
MDPKSARRDAVTLHDALEQSEPLARLQQRLAGSRQRFEVILPWLPASLVPQVRPGPLDEDGWSLLAANAAVAAKLRHLQPRLEDALRRRGWQSTPIRIKVQSI